MCRPTAARVVALLGLGLCAGCGGGDPAGPRPAPEPAPAVTGSPVSGSPSVDVAANTRAVCGRLANINFAGRQAFTAHWNTLLRAVAAGDEARGAAAGDAARQELQTWAVELDLLAGDAADTGLRTVILKGSATLVRLASDEDRTPVDQVLPRLAEIDTDYAGHCP